MCVCVCENSNIRTVVIHWIRDRELLPSKPSSEAFY